MMKDNSFKKLIPCSSTQGFTLLELTISIALIGIIVLIITGALRLGWRAIESGEKKIESLERSRTSFEIMDSQIQSYAPLTYQDEEDIEDIGKKYYFVGERNSMQFSTNYSVWGGEKGYVIATYTVTPGENGKQILSVSENVVGMETSRKTELFNTFEEIYFEYFYKDPTEEEGKWVDQWTETTGVPQKVKIHFIQDFRDLPLIIPLRAGKSPEDFQP